MKSLAFFSTFSPRRMGISDYSDDLVAALTEHFDVVCYHDGTYAPDRLPVAVEARPHTAFANHEDRALYQIGNSVELSFAIPHLVAHRGAVTLHDACQFDVTYPYFRERHGRFAREVLRNHPGAALRTLLKPSVRPKRMIERAFRTYEAHPNKRALFPFTGFILRHTDRLVVHSEFLRGHARRLRASLPIDVIPLGVSEAPEEPRARARAFLAEEYRVPDADDAPLFLSFGAIQPHKRIDAVLAALRRFLEECPNAHYVLVGPRDPSYDLDGAIARADVGRHVTVLDSYLSMDDVNSCIAACDLAFNLRWPSLGSTSSTLYKIFANGRTAAVTASESFADYPADMVFRIPSPDEGEVDACVDAMRAAVGDRDTVESMGRRARRFIESTCTWARVAERYAEALA